MRGLNLIRRRSVFSGKCGWAKYQQQQIVSKLPLGKKLRPVFPGSMLFNHILVPVSDKVADEKIPGLLPNTLDVEFEYCSRKQFNRVPSNSLLIDFDNTVELLPVDAIRKILDSDRSFEHIVVLGASVPRLLRESVAINTTDVPITAIEPEWLSANSLHALYRAARQVVLIDTMRVLDAAFTGCNCRLIVTDTLKDDPAFGLLLRELSRTSCQVSDVLGNPVLAQSHLEAQLGPFKIARNNFHDVQVLLSSRVEPSDWLLHEAGSGFKPIIDVANKKTSGFWTNVLDRRTRFARKAHKLREDPGAFLADSNHPVLKTMQRVLSSKQKAG